MVYDARGHSREPHTEEEFGIGTLEVRRYIRRWTHTTHRTIGHLTLPHEIETSGPTNRFRYALFLEKEGFNELLVRSQIETRYDLAIMSSKGQTVTSLRTLVEALSARGVTTLVGHDFDKAGLEILDKFTADTRRYTYQSAPCIGISGSDLPRPRRCTWKVSLSRMRAAWIPARVSDAAARPRRNVPCWYKGATD